MDSRLHVLRWVAVILVCCMARARCATISVSTSCTTSHSVQGQPASITCQFPEDLSVHKHNFRITRYDFTALRYLPEIVFECYWYLREDFHHCGTAAGFEFEGLISDTVTLKISNSTQRHAGVYKCDYINADYSHENGCSLYVREKEISCSGDSVYEGEPANVTCHYNSDLSMTYDSFYIAHLRPGDEYYFDVLTCIWTVSEPSHTLCYERPGYAFDGNASNTVTIHIPSANQSHVGHYFCDTSPTRTGVARPLCYFGVTGRTTVSSSSTPFVSTTTTSPPSSKQPGLPTLSYQPDPLGANSSTTTPPVGVLMQLLTITLSQIVQLICTCRMIQEFEEYEDDSTSPENHVVARQQFTSTTDMSTTRMTTKTLRKKLMSLREGVRIVTLTIVGVMLVVAMMGLALLAIVLFASEPITSRYRKPLSKGVSMLEMHSMHFYKPNFSTFADVPFLGRI